MGEKTSFFQLAVLVIFGGALVIGVLIFSGILPGYRSPLGGAGGVVVWWGTVPADDMAPFIEDFNRENRSQFTVRYEAKDPATYENDLVSALAAGKGPDIFTTTQEMLGWQRDKIIPLSFDLLSVRDFKNNYVESGEVFLSEEGVLAVPIQIDPLVMYSNRTLLTAAGWSRPPKLWRDFLKPENGLTVVDKKNAIVRSGLAFGGYNNVNNAKDIIAMLLLQVGNPIVVRDESTNKLSSALSLTLDYASSPAEAVIDYYVQFSDPTKSTYSWNNSISSSREAFAGENLVNYLGYASELPIIQQLNTHINLDVSLVPQSEELSRLTFGRVIGLAVARNSQKSAVAGRAILALADTKASGELSALTGLPPARRDLLENRHADPIQAVFYDSAIATRVWLDPDANETNLIFNRMIQSVITGQARTGEAVTRADGELANILRQKEYENVEQ